MKNTELRCQPVNIKKDTDSNIVYCGRGPGGKIPDKVKAKGWLGNPVPVSFSGTPAPCPVCSETHTTRGATLPCYKRYLFYKMNASEEFTLAIRELQGRKLGCFCKPDDCHTDVLSDAINWLQVDSNLSTLKWSTDKNLSKKINKPHNSPKFK